MFKFLKNLFKRKEKPKDVEKVVIPSVIEKVEPEIIIPIIEPAVKRVEPKTNKLLRILKLRLENIR